MGWSTWRDPLSRASTSHRAAIFPFHCRVETAAAPGASAALTELGQGCSSRLRLCQEIGFLSACSNLNDFRSHKLRPAPASENLMWGLKSKRLGLTDALFENSSSSEVLKLLNNERKMQEKPLSGWIYPSDTTPWMVSTIQQHLNVAAAPASSQPAQLMPEGAEGSPSPSLTPIRCWQTPLVLAGGSAQRQCSDSQAQLQFCGNKTLPCLTGRKKIRTNVLRKGGAGQPSQSKQALREGCGKEGTCGSQQPLTGCAEDRNGFLMLSSGTRWFSLPPERDLTDALILASPLVAPKPGF